MLAAVAHSVLRATGVRTTDKYILLNGATAEMLAQLNGLDSLPPRNGKKLIDFMKFLDRWEQRPKVNRKANMGPPISDDKPSIRYVIFPVTFEFRNIKPLICAVPAPFTYLVRAENGPL
ncbi:putative galactofuranosyltransferase [Leptomonas seymouri]|uniref:Putative galactofuranosyltransferase n=1 Tax=Leptomonas seymouri TaxID=5684 RepID=A0A0N0P2K8_LEPSE|nr:putative galactofuranosyltransferase [Leptomonas seymouri]|eukprot:KPI82637.1 putative galactofuranosyltransferase [Leptomonas seymouri]